MAGLTRGAKDKLTDEIQARICELVRGGMSYRSTCALVHLSQQTFFNWLKRGKTEKNTKFAEFFERVTEAKAQWEAICVRTVRTAIVGGWFDSPVYDRDGNPVPVTDPETGEVVRDERGRPKMHMKSEFRQPDANLAFRVMQRMNQAEFGQPEENTPDPQAELDKAPSVKLGGESDHKKISTSTLAKAVAFLAEQGVPIPGMMADPKKAKEAEVEDAVVVSEMPADPKLIEVKPEDVKKS